MSDQGSFYQRDRARHPPPLTPGYKTSVLRSPQKPLDLAREHAFRNDRPGVRSFAHRPPRQRPHPQFRQDRRSDRPAHDPLWPGSRRERQRRPWRAGRNLASQRRRALSPQEGRLPRAARPEFRRLRAHASPTTAAASCFAPSSQAPTPGPTASTTGGRRISISRFSVTLSLSVSSRNSISRAIR